MMFNKLIVLTLLSTLVTFHETEAHEDKDKGNDY